MNLFWLLGGAFTTILLADAAHYGWRRRRCRIRGHQWGEDMSGLWFCRRCGRMCRDDD